MIDPELDDRVRELLRSLDLYAGAAAGAFAADEARISEFVRDEIRRAAILELVASRVDKNKTPDAG